MKRRDSRDRRYRERLAASYLASLFFHTFLAMLLFSIASSSSQEGASESVVGGSFVTLEQRVAPVPVVPTQSERAAPLPNARIAAVLAHAQPTRPKSNPNPPRKHELAVIRPNSTPEPPTPLPQASPQPNEQPTAPVVEPLPAHDLPAVPSVAPSAAVVAVTVKVPPSVAPSPAPTTLPTARPSPRPPQPTSKPTVAPTVAPKLAASPSPVPSAAPAAVRPSAAPAKALGVPSPSPTQGPAKLETSKGIAPTPGPKGVTSPGPRAGVSNRAPPGVQRPVNVPPSPPPAPRSQGASSAHTPPDINARLRSLLPNGPVTYHEGTYHPTLTLGSLTPTPPPDVLAATKYLYEYNGTDRVKMWVTNVRHKGLLTICDGWMVRFPYNSQEEMRTGTLSNPVNHGIEIGVGGPKTNIGVLPPIIEANASTVCSERALEPFAKP